MPERAVIKDVYRRPAGRYGNKTPCVMENTTYNVTVAIVK